MIDEKQRIVEALRQEAPSQVDQVDDRPIKVETPVEARGGLLGRPVMLVLGVSLILAVLAGILVGVIPL
jgi:propanediol utilization protein